VSESKNPEVEMELSQTGLKAYCSGCRRRFDINSPQRQQFIEKYGCDDCRLDETTGDAMAKAIPKTTPKATVKSEQSKPKLVKGEGKEHPAVKAAKAKPIEVGAKLPGMETPAQQLNPAIEAKGVQKKKVSRDKVALMAEESKLDTEIRELLKAEGLTHYKSDTIDIELVPTKDKLIIKILDDEEDE
jgi:hypothetical protein